MKLEITAALPLAFCWFRSAIWKNAAFSRKIPLENSRIASRVFSVFLRSAIVGDDVFSAKFSWPKLPGLTASEYLFALSAAKFHPHPPQALQANRRHQHRPQSVAPKRLLSRLRGHLCH